MFLTYNFSNVCFQIVIIILISPFQRDLLSSYVYLSSSSLVLCITSLVWLKYRCSCVKSLKLDKYFENEFYFITKSQNGESQKDVNR